MATENQAKNDSILQNNIASLQLLLQANRKQVHLQRNGDPLLRNDHQDCRTMLRWDDQSVKKIVDNGK